MESLFDYIQASPVAIWGLLALLILCGLGLPMPEDIILIAAGILSAGTERSWVFVSTLMYFGVLAGDSLIFVIGRRFGVRLLSMRWTKRWLSAEKQQRIAGLFERYGSAVFFLARFMPGLRAPIFCSAGAMKVPYLRFLVFDGLAALISVPAFVWFGNFLWRKFGDDVEELQAVVFRTHSFTLGFGIIVLVVLASLIWFNRRKLFHVVRG